MDDETARDKAVNGLWPSSVGPVRQRGLRRWIKEFEKSGDVGYSGRGTNHPMYSPIHDVDVQSHMLAWLNTCPKNSVTIDKFLKYLNDELLPPLVNEGLFPPGYLSVSKSTAGNWLRRLGWMYGLIKKGAYTDGHDAPDTIAARNVFLKHLKLARTLSARVDPIDPNTLLMPNLRSKAAHKAARALGIPFKRHPPRVVIIYHDETTVRSQDGVRFAWMQAGTHGLMRKSLGRALMLSDFVCLDTGFLTCANEDGGTQSAGILWDVKTRGKYFDGEAVTEQWEKDAFPMFGRIFNPFDSIAKMIRARVTTRLPRAFGQVISSRGALRVGSIPGVKAQSVRGRSMRSRPRVDCVAAHDNVIGLWIFDCATSHTAFAQDALRTTPMNKGKGGKAPLMRDGWYWTMSAGGERVRVRQEMWVLDDKGERIPKGMQKVLEDRGLYNSIIPNSSGNRLAVCPRCSGALEKDPDRYSRTNCCCRRLLDSQPDFQEQQCRLAEMIASKGHLCLFLPKFHPELNPIERVWSAIKTYARKACQYTWDALKKLVPEAIASVTLVQIRNYFRACGRFASVYNLVQNDAALAEHIVRSYRSHRGVTKHDLQKLVEKLLHRIKTEKASSLEERHYVLLQRLLRQIHQDAEEAERMGNEGPDNLRTVLRGGELLDMEDEMEIDGAD